MDRRTFIGQTLAAGSALVWLPPIDQGPIDPSLVKEFVGQAHRDLDKVKELLEETPHLLNAAWDWGDGDFETAIGAAGHVGHKDMAHFLIAQGACANIFVWSMLGQTELVKSILHLYPSVLHSTGPHGFTLLHHAEKGGEDGLELAAYFKDQGLSQTIVKMYQK